MTKGNVFGISRFFSFGFIIMARLEFGWVRRSRVLVHVNMYDGSISYLKTICKFKLHVR